MATRTIDIRRITRSRYALIVDGRTSRTVRGKANALATAQGFTNVVITHSSVDNAALRPDYSCDPRPRNCRTYNYM